MHQGILDTKHKLFLRSQDSPWRDRHHNNHRLYFHLGLKQDRAVHLAMPMDKPLLSLPSLDLLLFQSKLHPVSPTLMVK